MNFLGTHDTPRILTVLGYRGVWPQSREERARISLNAAERFRGLRLLRLAALVMYAFPGSPTIYYGDEAGMDGFEDPFNRATYPWDREDTDLRSFFIRLGALRKARGSLQHGSVEFLLAEGALLAFRRVDGNEVSIAVCNAAETEMQIKLPWKGDYALDAITGERFRVFGGSVRLTLAPMEGALLIEG